MKLGFVIIYVDDVTQSIDFYHRAFGIDKKSKYVLLSINKATLQAI